MTFSALKGDFQTANSMQENILELVDALFSDVNPIPIKTAMKILDYDIGYLRGPLCQMDNNSYTMLQAVLKKYNSIIKHEDKTSLQ